MNQMVPHIAHLLQPTAVDGELVDRMVSCGDHEHPVVDGELECCCGDHHTITLDRAYCCDSRGGCGHIHDVDGGCSPRNEPCGSYECCIP